MSETLEDLIYGNLQFEDNTFTKHKINISQIHTQKRWPAGKTRPAADQQDTHEGLYKGR